MSLSLRALLLVVCYIISAAYAAHLYNREAVSDFLLTFLLWDPSRLGSSKSSDFLFTEKRAHTVFQQHKNFMVSPEVNGLFISLLNFFACSRIPFKTNHYRFHGCFYDVLWIWSCFLTFHKPQLASFFGSLIWAAARNWAARKTLIFLKTFFLNRDILVLFISQSYWFWCSIVIWLLGSMIPWEALFTGLSNKFCWKIGLLTVT